MKVTSMPGGGKPITKRVSEAEAERQRKGPTLSELAEKVEEYFRHNPRMEEYLRTNPEIRRFFIRVAGENDSRKLAELLCNAVLTLNTRTTAVDRIRPNFTNTMRSLRDFPETIRTFAEKLQDNIEVVFHPKPELRSIECKELPERLKRFADKLEKQLQTKRESPGMAKRVWASVGYDMREQLARFVESKTGTQNYQEVAGLLTGTAIALGIDMTFDRDTLKVEIPRWRKERAPSSSASPSAARIE